jgi:hypothetical protein
VRGRLEFEGLFPSEGTEVIRLQFSPKRGTTLDIPLSAKALSDLERTLSLLRGILPEEMAETIDGLVKDGKVAFSN